MVDVVKTSFDVSFQYPCCAVFSQKTVRLRQFRYLHHTTQADTFQVIATRRGILSRQLHTRKLLSTHEPVGYS